MSTSWALRSSRVVLPDGTRPATVVIEGERIAAVLAHEAAPPGCAVRDLGDLLVFPGVVDTHVHVNDPGRSEWEGFETASRAAAAGGVTTIVDMPLNSIPAVTTTAGLSAKLERASAAAGVDLGFWGGVVPGNTDQLEGLADAGVRGFKCFLVDSGVEEFPPVDEIDLDLAMPVIARLGLPLLVHAELAGPCPEEDPAQCRSYDAWLASRPASWETEAVRLMIRLSRRHRCRVHVVHLSSTDALADIDIARADDVPITVETCPHYLLLSAEDVPEGATEFKCAPPIRSREERNQLRRALESRRIDLVASDHSPCPAALKLPVEGDFQRAWGGVASLQLTLPLMLDALHAGSLRLDHSRLAHLLATAPARLAGLGERKGAIVEGLDADLVIVDTEASFVVDPHTLEHRHPVTPYAGKALRGVVLATLLRGAPVYDRDTMFEPSARSPGSTLLL